MIDWATIEAAIYTWATTATGVTVQWASQDAPMPAYPYVSLKRLTPGLKEHDFDELRSAEDPGGAAGEEIVQTVAGPRAFTVSVQAFAASDAPAANADHYLTLAVAALELPSVRRALRAASAVPVEVVGGQDLDDIAGGGWRSRSNVDIKFRTTSSVSEATGYISTVELTSTVTNPDDSTIERTETMGDV